jgi:drug efflux transport system ATP-binding protein
VREGEVFGLLGPDGAGKTTLIRVLCGLIPPDEGDVTVAGCDVARVPESVRTHVGYLSQRFGLWGDLTVAENVAFCADLFGVRRREYEDRLRHLLEITRLAPFTDRQAQFLSGGMRQKLALMCTLIHRPQVLLLDEPTTGVDPASRRDFWRLLYGLPAEGVTILVSTPYMDEAERCDRVALIHGGRLLACASPAELKGRLTGSLLNVVAAPQAEARRVLGELPEVESVTVFGDRLHVSAAAETEPEALSGPLRAAGIEVTVAEPVAPSLEDVFTAALREEAAKSA